MDKLTRSVLEPGLPVAAPGRRDVPLTSVQRSTAVLLLVFLFTIPLINPWVRGDGVGYYAYVRSLMVEHRLDFTRDWHAGNDSFVMYRINRAGNIVPSEYTRTGHLRNHWSIGPALLWAPFLVPLHAVMLILRHLGWHVTADGFSRPYIVTMALASALYGLIGLLLSFWLARRYAGDRWALISTLGIWFASSLPVYMYFNPSWSHAHSVFSVALFLWYWERTRGARTSAGWLILGLLSGLMVDVYYLNAAVALVPILESASQAGRGWRSPPNRQGIILRLVKSNALYCLGVVVAFVPTLVVRAIVSGSPFDMGYSNEWRARPMLLQVFFSSDHGLFTWTPVLFLAVMGLLLLCRRDKELAAYILIACAAFDLVVSFHADWDGLSSFGGRFFISLTPFFVLGLAIFFQDFARLMKSPRRAMGTAISITALLIVWNLAFIFQWGTHMVPARGPISWKEMVRNQFVEVPDHAWADVSAYAIHRRALMRQIEQSDVRQLRDKAR